jgi:hypothetical protein
LQRAACCLLHAGFLLGLLFNPEDGGDILLRNFGWLSKDYTALYPKSLHQTAINTWGLSRQYNPDIDELELPEASNVAASLNNQL